MRSTPMSWLCGVWLALFPMFLPAEVETETKVGIDAAAWLAGRWVGEGLGGQVEETWAPAAGSQMVGHFQLVKDGKVVFYELMLIDVVEGGLRLRVKHFHPDFKGWEEKDGWHSFEPRGASDGKLEFKGLRLQRTGMDEAEFVVTLRRGEEVTDEVLKMKRQPL